MWTRQHKKRRSGILIVPTITVAFIAYFGFHAYQGKYGIYSKYLLQERVAELQVEFDELREQRLHLEQRVRLLHDGTLERDMLDEQSRRALNLAHPDEITIMRARIN